MSPSSPAWEPPRPTQWQIFRQEPVAFIARRLHHLRPVRSTQPTISAAHPITIVCISDTHNTKPSVPDGDLLVVAGDLTNGGSFEELQAQLDWLASLPHRHKVAIAGNHDRLLDAAYVARHPDRICEAPGKSRADLDWHDLIYLQNSSATLQFAGGRGLMVFGSPMTPDCGTFAFQYPPIRDVWAGLVPEGTDVLLTHGPPRGYLDAGGKGCPHLTREMARARPRVVVFGHIHVAAGRQAAGFDGFDGRYQKVMAGDQGLVACGTMAAAFLLAWATRVLAWVFGPRGGSAPRPAMVLVNAAVVGGRDNTVSRPATVVTL